MLVTSLSCSSLSTQFLMQYLPALPGDRRNKATRRERLVSLGAAGTMSYLHLGKSTERDVLAIWCGYESVTRDNRISYESYQLIHCTV